MMLMRSSLSMAVTALLALYPGYSCSAFTVNTVNTVNAVNVAPSTSSTNLQMSRSENNDNDNDRRAFLSKIATVSAAATAATFLPTPPSAMAFGGALNKVNAKLQSYGLPQLKEVPSGFTPLLELYGKGRNRKPLLVEFLFPSDWVVVLPNIDVNSEEGTIQAGQYSAGDTATFFVLKDSEKVEDITSQPKEFFQNAVIKAISQKGDNIYQNFKITKLEPKDSEYKNQKYMLVDFKYELLTGAGFEVDRRGVASVTSQGDGVQVLWTASTRQRYKKTEDALRTIAGSFRCYGEGLGLSVGIAEKNDDF